jgi:hypothetical protein
MSTKIYNGLILRNSTLEQALSKLIAMRPACVEAAKTYAARMVAKKMVFAEDFALNLCSIREAAESPFWRVFNAFSEAKVDVLGKGVRNTAWDSSFEVCLIPAGADLLALYYIENDHGYTEALRAAGFEDYHYQNSTDRPDSVSEEEWRAREEAWSRALPRRVAPGQAGLAYTVVSWDDFGDALLDRKLVEGCVPADDKRRRAVAVRLTEMEVGRNHPELGIWEQVKLIEAEAPLRCESVLLAEQPLG